jgi:hypothetical protein
MKALLFICVPFIFRIAEGAEQHTSGRGTGREARREPGRQREFEERPFLRLETEKSPGELLKNLADF